MEIIKKDLVIIGGGCAGLSAAVYGRRAGMNLVVLENELVGGQTAISSTVENYIGFEHISGRELTDRFRSHAVSCGAEIDEFDFVEGVYFSEERKETLMRTKKYVSEAVIIATGAAPVRLNIKNESERRGKGVHYCALCDANAYKHCNVGVVGGGRSAIEEALYLSGIADSVVIICRDGNLNAEKSMLMAISENKRISVLYNTVVTEVWGASSLPQLEYVQVTETNTGMKKSIQLAGLFVCIGRAPQSELFKEYVKTDARGYIDAGENTHTSVSGIFAAGDVRTKRWRQIITAVSDGAVAALEAEKYLSEKRREKNA